MPEETPNLRETTASAEAPTLDPDFIALLACPVCDDRPPLRLAPDSSAFLCGRCGRAYPIRDGFPDLVPEDAILPGTAVSEPAPTGDQ